MVFLRSNYLDSLAVIRDNKQPITSVLSTHKITGDDLIKFHEEEREYLESLKRIPLEELDTIAYVKALENLWKLEYVFIFFMRSKEMRLTRSFQARTGCHRANIRQSISRYCPRCKTQDKSTHYTLGEEVQRGWAG